MASPDVFPRTPTPQEIPHDAVDPQIRVANVQALSAPELVGKMNLDAESRGFTRTDPETGLLEPDLRGMRIQLGNGQLLVVNDSFMASTPKLRERRTTVLPHFGKGSHIPRYKKERTMYKRVGAPRPLPWLNRERALIGRKEVPIGDELAQKAAFHVYQGEKGPLVDVQVKGIEDLYALGIKHGGIAWIDWAGRAEDVAGAEREIALGIDHSKGSVYEQLNERLRQEGVSSWEGLSWTREWSYAWEDDDKGKGKVYKKIPPRSLKGTVMGAETGLSRAHHSELLDVVRERQEVIFDGTVRGKNYNKTRDFAEPRFFIVRTVREFKNGTVRTEDQSFRDHELRKLLDGGATDGLTFITGARFVDRVQRPITDTAANSPFATMTPDQLRDRRERDRTEFLVPTAVEATYGPAAKPELEEALGILATRVGGYPITDEGFDRLVKRIEKMEESAETVSLAEELQNVIEEAGSDYFEGVLMALNDELTDALNRSEEKLTLPYTPAQDDGWILEGLLERSMEIREAGHADAFKQVMKMPYLKRDLVDRRIGELFAIESIRTESVKVPYIVKKGEIKGDQHVGEQRFREEVHHDFDDHLFERIPLLGGYGDWKPRYDWRKKEWGPIEDMARMVAPRIAEKEPVDYETLERFGRMLREAIGE